MSTDSFYHADCGGSLSLFAGVIYCAHCGHIPIDGTTELDSVELSDFLPCLVQADIIASSDFQGMAIKPI